MTLHHDVHTLITLPCTSIAFNHHNARVCVCVYVCVCYKRGSLNYKYKGPPTWLYLQTAITNCEGRVCLMQNRSVQVNVHSPAADCALTSGLCAACARWPVRRLNVICVVTRSICCNRKASCGVAKYRSPIDGSASSSKKMFVQSERSICSS